MNSKAILIYVANNKERITLYSSSLKNIDNITRLFKNETDFIKNSASKEKVVEVLKGKVNEVTEEHLELLYIDGRDKSERLPIIYNDEAIYLGNNFEEKTEDEIEVARRLIWSSKDDLFLEKILESPIIEDTTASFIIVRSAQELKELMKNEIKTYNNEGSYYVSLKDMLLYKLNHKKLGLLRSLVEDSLELWKKKIKALNSDLEYYYARELRRLVRSYEKDINQKFYHHLIIKATKGRYHLIRLDIPFRMV